MWHHSLKLGTSARRDLFQSHFHIDINIFIFTPLLDGGAVRRMDGENIDCLFFLVAPECLMKDCARWIVSASMAELEE